MRLYAAATWLLPGDLRRTHADDATRLFGELYADELRRRGCLAGWLFWTRSTWLLGMCTLRALSEYERGNTNRGGGGMGDPLRDFRYGLRALVKRPAFSLTAALILATGIGATTTIFSVVDTVVLRPLPYPEAGRLVHFDNGAHSFPSFRAWQEMSSFEAVAAVRDEQVHLIGEGAPAVLLAVSVSYDFFRMFGGSPHIGRLFHSGDHAGDRSVVVLGHDFWMGRLGSDPDVIGRTLSLDGTPSEIVGVLDRHFHPPELDTGSRVDVWFPLGSGGLDANDHGRYALGVTARLGPGVSIEMAQAEVDAQRRAIADEAPENYYARDGSLETTPLVPLREATVQGVRGTLLTLLGAVGILLGIACANVGNLFLARGSARSPELALRAALGASRVQIIRQVLAESVTLAIGAGAVGVGVAFGGVEIFSRLNPGGIPRVDSVGVDLRVLLFSLVTSTLTGVLLGGLPALRATRLGLTGALNRGRGGDTSDVRGRRFRSGLVVSEIALAVVLVTGAGLLLRSFVARAQVNPGFEAASLVIVPLALTAGYDETSRLQFADQLLEGALALPGTREAAAGWTSPFKFTGGSRCCWRTLVTGDPGLAGEEDRFRGITHPVTEGYFAALKASLVEGREFTHDDGRTGANAAILNRPAARKLFGTEEVVGRTIDHRGEPLEIVGVIDGVYHWGPTQGVEEAVYVPYARYGPRSGDFDLIVRTDADLEVAARRLREVIWALDPDLPIPEVTTMERRMSASLATPRFLSGLLGGFATVALLLAAGGIYGSMLYSVGQRRREMGIRLAVGATGSDVVRLVMREGALLATIGIALGGAAAFAMSGVLAGLLWGVQPTDPLTFGAVPFLLGGIALAAAFLPAWRAGRTDPVQTLRVE